MRISFFYPGKIAKEKVFRYNETNRKKEGNKK